VVPILDVMFKGKILKQRELVSVLLACFGVGLLELGPSGGLHVTSGDLLAFAQTIFFGIGYWRLESESHAHSNQAARLTVGQLTAVACGAVVYALTEIGLGHVDIASMDQLVDWLGDPFILGALVWTGLVSTALALVRICSVVVFFDFMQRQLNQFVLLVFGDCLTESHFCIRVDSSHDNRFFVGCRFRVRHTRRSPFSNWCIGRHVNNGRVRIGKYRRKKERTDTTLLQ
jgi:hypothetical protein